MLEVPAIIRFRRGNRIKIDYRVHTMRTIITQWQRFIVRLVTDSAFGNITAVALQL
jgi:hypothetical protein